MILFNSEPKKLLEIALYLMNISGKINLYNLLKCVFYADEYHLNKYGRPVSGDYFEAQPYGTVPYTINNMVNKKDEEILAILKLEEYPFEKEGYFLKAKRNTNLKQLSQTDQEALKYAFNIYGALSFEELKNINHKHKAYDNAIKRGLFSVIDFKDMIQDDNPYKDDILADLEETAQYMVI